MGTWIALAAALVIVWALLTKNAGALSLMDSSPLPDVPVTPQPGEPAAPAVAMSAPSKVSQFAKAIAYAEGFGQPGAVPTRSNNPGDLGPGDTGFPGTFTDGSTVSQLPDVATGWALLEQKISNAFAGKSAAGFSSAMTFTEWGKLYAGDWVNWSKNVAAYLGVDPNMRISDWLQQ